MARVLLKNVTKTYDGDVRAVDNATLEVGDQEFMVIVGPSGCGKTTALRLIAGLEEPTSGEIAIGGRAVNGIPPNDRHLAMVFQNYALYPHMTAFQNMAFGLKLRKYSKDEIARRVKAVAELLDINDILNRKPQTLSGGQRQRIALGRAVVGQPQVFLFDEPLSNLDARSRIATRAELKAIHSQVDATSIYVTHDQTEAMSLGDRIAVMYKGALLQVGEPMQVYKKPANRFIASFISTSAVNFCSGTIQSKNNALHFVSGEMDIAITDRRMESAVASQKPESMK